MMAVFDCELLSEISKFEVRFVHSVIVLHSWENTNNAAK